MSYPTTADRELAKDAYHAFSERSPIRETFDRIRKPVYAALVAATALGATAGVANAQSPHLDDGSEGNTIQAQSGRIIHDFEASLRTEQLETNHNAAGAALSEAIRDAETQSNNAAFEQAVDASSHNLSSESDLLRSLAHDARIENASNKDNRAVTGPPVEGFPKELQQFATAMELVVEDAGQRKAIAKFADYAQLYGLSVDEASEILKDHKDEIAFPGWEMLGFQSHDRGSAKTTFEYEFRVAYLKLAESHPGELPTQPSGDHNIQRFDNGFKYVNTETGKIENPFGGEAVKMNKNGDIKSTYALDGQPMSKDAYMETIQDARSDYFQSMGVEPTERIVEADVKPW